MTTIKRFTPDYKMHAVRFEAFAREAEHGELVQFDDHQQAVSDLEAERDAARNAIAAIYKAVTGECPEWSNWHAYLEDIVEEVGAAIAANQTADALAVENAALKSAITGKAYIDFVTSNGWNPGMKTINGKFAGFMDAEIDFGCMAYDHAKKLIDAVETPATDAALAAIEARSITVALDSCSEYLDTDCVMDRIGISYADAELRSSGAMELCNALKSHAKQLREAK